MAKHRTNSIFGRLMTWLGLSGPFSKQEQADLKQLHDGWVGDRDPKLEKTVKQYNY